MFGERLKDQVEERLKFYETGDVPRKNAEVMKAALEEHNTQVKLEKKSNKRKLEEAVNGTYIQTANILYFFILPIPDVYLVTVIAVPFVVRLTLSTVYHQLPFCCFLKRAFPCLELAYLNYKGFYYSHQ